MRLVKALLIAISMYSKIPVPTVEWSRENMKYAMCFFPVIGCVTGALVYLAGFLLLEFTDCSALFFGALMILIPAVVTGGIHLDGFADTVDALSSYGPREKKLEILKDPHTGAFAVIALCCYFTASLALWSEADLSVLPVLACIFPFSRALSGIAVVTFPAAKDSGLLKTFQDGAHKKRVRITLVVWAAASAAAMLLLDIVTGAAAVVTGGIVFGAYYRMSMKNFGGITGDLAGYFLQICELAMPAAVILSGGCLWK